MCTLCTEGYFANQYHIFSIDLQLGNDLDKEVAIEMYKNGSIPLKYKSPSYRDTIHVPAAGMVVARFVADNPGDYRLYQGEKIFEEIKDILETSSHNRRSIRHIP